MKKHKMLIECVAKQATEHWGVWIMEFVKFSKEISKVCEKYWYDCFSKWYPADTVDYEPTGNTYYIKTVEDIAKLTPAQFEFFIEDLRNFCNIIRTASEISELAPWSIIIDGGMTWCDDWLNEGKITIQAETTNKL